MRSPGTYRVRSFGQPVAREMLDFTGDIGGTIALFGFAGLGALPSMQQSGFFTVDCSSPIVWAFNPACWDNSPAVWAQMNAIATAAGPMPQPHPPTGPSTIQEETVPGAFTPDQAIAGGYALTQQQLQDYFGGVAQSLSNMPAGTGAAGSPTGLSPLAIGAVAIGLLAVGLLLFTPSISVVPGRRR